MRVGFRRSVVSVLRHLLADVSSTWICEFDQVVSSNGLRLVKCYGVEMDGSALVYRIAINCMGDGGVSVVAK